jgi:hypothetical protein
MSVRTTADEKLDEARDHIDKAYRALNEIVIEKCMGHEDYTAEFQHKLRTAFFALQSVKIHIDR